LSSQQVAQVSKQPKKVTFSSRIQMVAQSFPKYGFMSKTIELALWNMV
jgi:hypothetical protein